jgi:drug/metabolite transporter (DMT)-like permease
LARPVKPRDLLDLLALAAIWGGSFLFMRLAAPEVAPSVVAFLRVLLASLVLVPWLLWRGLPAGWHRTLGHVGWVGLINSALPFLAYAFAAASITAGLSSIFNATTPLWAALIAWLWLGERPSRWRALGLTLGFAGVLWLAWDKAGLRPGAGPVGPVWAVLACIAATVGYGLAANHTRRFLGGVPPLALAAGSQLSATLVLAGPAAAAWPAAVPSATAVWSIVALGLLCSAAAYVLYFRLIARVGPSRAVTVTFLVPVFAVLWGALFLDERITPVMAGACGVILLGTALVTGLLGPRPAPAGGISGGGPSGSR